jgi:hypothetical protein
MVHARGQQTLEDKRRQYKDDMVELMDVQNDIDQVSLSLSLSRCLSVCLSLSSVSFSVGLSLFFSRALSL